jgi:hypothetical protein
MFRYYYTWFYRYDIYISYSTVDSSEVTTTTTVSIYASNSAEAAESFSQKTATWSLPTPINATPLPSLTHSSASSTSTTRALTTNAATGVSTGSSSGVTGAALSGALEKVAPVWKGKMGYLVLGAAVVGPLVLAIRL